MLTKSLAAAQPDDGRPAYPSSGIQQPRILTHPPFTSSAGVEAVEMAQTYGLQLDPWQETSLNVMLAEDDLTGKWVCFECGLVCSRQNGKGAILEARHLAGLTLFGEMLQLYSCHEFKTAAEFFLRFKMYFTEYDDLRRRVKKISEAHGEEGITLLNGARLRIVARSKGSGRGFSGDLLTWDEAMILQESAVEASMPTLSARHGVTPGGPQLLYAGSAGDETSIVFGRVRARGLRGNDPSLAFIEHSADEELWYSLETDQQRKEFLDDPHQWALGNPAAGYRIPFSHIAKERRSMSDEAFLRERLSIGRWPDPTAGTSPISEEQWDAVGDEQARGETSPVAFAIDMPPDRSATSVGVARFMDDGRVQVEVVARRQGTSWVKEWILERIERWDPVAVAIGAGSPAFSLEQELAEAIGEIDTEMFMVVSASDQTAACGAFYDDVVPDDRKNLEDWSPGLVHRNQAILNSAVKGAVKKKTQDTWKFDRSGLADISPLWSVVLARYALKERADAEYDVEDSVG